MRSEIPYGYIYKVTNKINGKSYVGMRKLSKDRAWRQYLGSGKLLQQALSKYGEENFIKELVCYAYTLDELQETEWKKIKYFKSLGQAEYNLFTGKGAGGDTFALLAGDRKAEVLRRQTEGLRRTAAERGKRAALKNENRFQKFIHDNQYELEVTYRNTCHTTKTANHFNVPTKWIARFVHESGLIDELAEQRESKRLLAQKLYFEDKTGRPVRSKLCQNCEKAYSDSKSRYCSESCKDYAKKIRSENRKPSPIFTSSYEELYKLWIIEDKSISELMEVFGCKQRTVYYLLEDNGLPTRKYDARKIRDELFPKSLRSCDFCEGDIPKQYKGSTCSHKCRVNKCHRDKLLAQ